VLGRAGIPVIPEDALVGFAGTLNGFTRFLFALVRANRHEAGVEM
jgi:hypothetical protein